MKLKNTGIGVDIEGEKVTMLAYADDIVLLTETPQELQILLNELDTWCNEWNMSVNKDKTQIIHFRNPSMPVTDHQFCISNQPLQTVQQYKYLGLIFTEYLDFNVTVKAVAKVAHRAVGLLIAKIEM